MMNSETAFNAETFSPIMTIDTWLSKINELKGFYGRDVLLTFSDNFPIIVGRFVPEPEAVPVVEVSAEVAVEIPVEVAPVEGV